MPGLEEMTQAKSFDGPATRTNSISALTTGQMVPHLHGHVIPCYAGDAQYPRGGVRWVFPEQADCCLALR